MSSSHVGYMLRHQVAGIIPGDVWMRPPSESDLATIATTLPPGWLRVVEVRIHGSTEHAKRWHPVLPLQVHPEPALEMRMEASGSGTVVPPTAPESA